MSENYDIYIIMKFLKTNRKNVFLEINKDCIYQKIKDESF